MIYKKLVIGVDQSYTKTGIAIAADGQLLKVTSIPFIGLSNNTEKRKKVSNIITNVLKSNMPKSKETLILCERIRTFSGGFLSTGYIKSTGALIATIVDAAYEFNVRVYSVDTRCWKAAVLGKAHAGKGNDKKLAALKYVYKLGFKNVVSINKRGKKVYDDDAADAGCIALSGFHKHVLDTIKLEQ